MLAKIERAMVLNLSDANDAARISSRDIDQAKRMRLGEIWEGREATLVVLIETGFLVQLFDEGFDLFAFL